MRWDDGQIFVTVSPLDGASANVAYVAFHVHLTATCGWAGAHQRDMQAPLAPEETSPLGPRSPRTTLGLTYFGVV